MKFLLMKPWRIKNIVEVISLSVITVVMCYVHKVEEMYLKIEFGQEEETAI